MEKRSCIAGMIRVVMLVAMSCSLQSCEDTCSKDDDCPSFFYCGKDRVCVTDCDAHHFCYPFLVCNQRGHCVEASWDGGVSQDDSGE
jgi:hypothetical protein